MTSRSEVQLLREVLAHEAERHGIPGYDPVEVVAGGARPAPPPACPRRRCRPRADGRRGLRGPRGAGPSPRDAARETVPQGTLHRVPDVESPSAPTIPYCRSRSADLASDVLHAGGTALVTDCSYARPHHRYLWYHAGRTVMSSPDGLEVLVGHRLVTLSGLQSPGVRISMDGRYLAWFEQDALFVYDLAAGRPAGAFVMPDAILSAGIPSIEGMDWSGRTYVQVSGALWVHDIGRDRWSEVRGLPSSRGAREWAPISYLTPEGLAVESEDLVADERGKRSGWRGASRRTARSSRCARCPSARRCGPRTAQASCS